MDKLSFSIDWPTAMLVFALVFVVIFRREIAQLIARTRRVGTAGLETYEAAPPPAQGSREGVENFFRSFDNPLLVEAEGAIIKDLVDRKIEAPADRERTLVRALAVC